MASIELQLILGLGGSIAGYMVAGTVQEGATTTAGSGLSNFPVSSFFVDTVDTAATGTIFSAFDAIFDYKVWGPGLLIAMLGGSLTGSYVVPFAGPFAWGVGAYMLEL